MTRSIILIAQRGVRLKINHLVYWLLKHFLNRGSTIVLLLICAKFAILSVLSQLPVLIFFIGKQIESWISQIHSMIPQLCYYKFVLNWPYFKSI